MTTKTDFVDLMHEHAALVEIAATLERERNELVAALRDMIHFDDLLEAEQQPAMKRARAALAKVKA